MGRRRLARRDIIVAIIGLIIGLAALLLWLSPRVIEPDPEEVTLSALKPLVITLNRPVSPDSVPAHFFISPDVPGTLDVSGRQIIFQPDEPFDYDRTYTVSLSPGIRGSNGLPGLVGATLTYVVEEPHLLFLREVDGRSNLWRRGPDGVLHQLTDEPAGVWDFESAPDGQGILFSSLGPDGSADLVLLASDGSRDVVLECPDERCISGQWQPGGPLIAFERIPLAEDANNTAEVWLLDTSNGALEPAIESNALSETGLLGRENNSPRWSTDGRYLALFHPDARVVLIRDLVGGSINLVPANLEIMGGWSPAAGRLSYSELAFGQEISVDPDDPPGADSSTAIPSLYNHITVVDVDTELATDLSAGQEMDYGRPAWHPDGEALAVPRGTKGGAWQIWLLAVDGGDPQVLTNNPSMNHSALAWSPAGQQLAFMGNDRGDSSTGPAVWLLDTDTGQVEMIIEGAYLPAWQP